MVSVSAIFNGVGTVYKYGKRILNVTPELAFGTASEKMGKVMKDTSGSVFTKAQAGWHELENAGKGSFFKKFWKNCKNFFPDMASASKAGWKIAEKNAVKAGKTAGFFTKASGAFKGIMKKFGKKMPFIMSAVMILTELPNVIKATKEQGIVQGGKEVLKFGARMAGAGLGAAIGAALPIPFGSLIGWTVGEWITSKIVGKSYTEQQEEKQQIIQEALNPQQAINPQQNGQVQPQPAYNNPYWLNNQPAQGGQVAFNGNMSNPYYQYQMQNMPYADDIMMKQMPFNVIA